PLSADQPDNAKKCAALGVARTVGPSTLLPATVRSAALDLLNNSSYRSNARRQRDAMAALPGVERAVVLIEERVSARGTVWAIVA
ncbi:MAG: glycosyltransferase, partial [Chloroflexota bacterium]